jgi:hypothetical protein
MTERARNLFRHFVQAGVPARARKTRTKPPSRGFVHFVHAPEHRPSGSSEEFVGWWHEKVRREGRPEKLSPDKGLFTVTQLETQTGISDTQVSKWAKRTAAADRAAPWGSYCAPHPRSGTCISTAFSRRTAPPFDRHNS